MAAARPSAYNAEFRVFILVLRRRRPVVWFPAGEVAGATRVVAFYRARGMAHPVPRKQNIARIATDSTGESKMVQRRGPAMCRNPLCKTIATASSRDEKQHVEH